MYIPLTPLTLTLFKKTRAVVFVLGVRSSIRRSAEIQTQHVFYTGQILNQDATISLATVSIEVEFEDLRCDLKKW